MKRELAPSILSADFSRLGEQIASVEPYSGRLHVDVMDGHFVPNISIGPLVVESIRPVTDLPIEVHLMISEPARYLDRFLDAGADSVIFHIEVEPEPLHLINRIRERGAAAGLAVSPGTLWEEVSHLVEHVDLMLVMTVEPGFGGQAFMSDMMPKVASARKAVIERQTAADIEVDGGIDQRTAHLALEAGANVFVAGNSVFKAESPAEAARQLAGLLSDG